MWQDGYGTGRIVPSFSQRSRERLDTCDARLRRVFDEVVRTFDCSILEGHRERERQNQMVREGASQLHWPDSKHNAVPSKAVDVAPYPIDWTDRERFSLFAGYVMGIAASHGVRLRWGGDWRMDWNLKNNNFDDLPHFELVE